MFGDKVGERQRDRERKTELERERGLWGEQWVEGGRRGQWWMTAAKSSGETKIKAKIFLIFSIFFLFFFGFLRTRPVPHLAATAAFAASFADSYWLPLCAGSAAAPQRTPRPLLVILMRHSTRSSWQRCCCHCWLRWCCRQRREQRCQRLQCAKCCCKCRL